MVPGTRRLLNSLPIAVLCASLAASSPARSQAAAPATHATPQAAVDELLAADRAFSAASMKTDLVSGLAAMFDAEVIMPLPNGRFAEGAPNATEALRNTPDNVRSRIEWTPIRGGISADAQHGFTFGYMTLHRPDGTKMPLRYMSYWIRRPDGWHVAVYKRARGTEDEPKLAPMPASLPERIVPATTDAATIEPLRQSLAKTEGAFSDEAQRIGLGPAFVKYGSADAVNMGGPSGYAVGSETIGRRVSEGEPPSGSSVSWGADKAIVASSGDLGVTIGVIRPNTPPANGAQPAGFPFFTIWRRAGPAAPWRYIAE